MNIREALAAEHSKRQTNRIVAYIGGDPEKFRELMDLVLSGDYVTVQRATWSLNHCARTHPELFSPYTKQLISILERDDVHTGAQRHVIQAFESVEIPSRYKGKLYDLCLGFVDDPSSPIAVRVFAMTVAAKIANGERSLLNELKQVVEKNASYSSAALRARARKVLDEPRGHVLRNKVRAESTGHRILRGR